MSASPFLQLHALDDVLVAARQILPGQPLMEGVVLRDFAPAGACIARRTLVAGQAVVRGGIAVGKLVADVDAGRIVDLPALTAPDAPPPALNMLPSKAASTFMGFRRQNGSVGTRNYIGVIAASNCAATVTRSIAQHFTRERLADWPRIDGVVALVHSGGCGMADPGETLSTLQRTIVGYARHPNLAGVLIVGLGCEANQVARLLKLSGDRPPALLHSLDIQSARGSAGALREGIDAVCSMLDAANAFSREAVPLSALTVALNGCGGDGMELTAGPVMGAAMEMLMARGATVVMGETPDFLAAEGLLYSRAARPEVAEKMASRLAWWQVYLQRQGSQVDGMRMGGLQRALSALSRGGAAPIVEAVEYADPIPSKGLVFMDTPRYTPVSVTGLVAGGAQLVCFATGHGSPFGAAAAPTLKVAGSTALWQRQGDDLDVNAGDVLEGVAVEEAGERLFEAILTHASGRRTRAEAHGYGFEEFVPWMPGGVL